jgi:nucleoside-diphosphate-sugar epimerase
MTKTILITGATGFVGSELAPYLTNQGHRVIGISRREIKNKNNGNSTNEAVNFIQWELFQESGYLESVDVIIHLAAQSPYNAQKPIDYIIGNVLTTRAVLKYACHFKPKLFIFFSGISVYGRIKETVLTETTDIVNPDMYGLSKYMAEQIVLHDSEQYPVMVLRLPGIIGKGAHSCWLANIVHKMKKNESIHFYHPHALFNNVIHLQDVFHFIGQLISNIPYQSDIINLAASQPMSITDILGYIQSKLRSSSEFLENPSDQNSYIISTKKAESNFGFMPNSVKQSLEFFLEDF